MRIAVFVVLWSLAGAIRADVMLVQGVQQADPAGGFKPAQDIVIYMAADRLRLDSGEISSIIRRDRGLTYSVAHADRSFVRLAHPGGAAAAVLSDEKPGAGVAKSIRTGKTDSIHGFNCQEVRIEQFDGTVVDAWVAADARAASAADLIKKWRQQGYRQLISGMGFRPASEQGGVEGIPIRATVTGPAGKPELRVEIKKFETSPLKEDVFEPPPGYREVSMDDTAGPAELSDLEARLKEKQQENHSRKSPHAKP